MIRPLALTLRILAILATAAVKILEAVAELITELTGIVLREILQPAVAQLRQAQRSLEQESGVDVRNPVDIHTPYAVD